MKRCFFLASIAFLLLIGCSFDSQLVKDRSRASGIPIEKQRVLFRLMESGDKADGLTDSEWTELQKMATDPDSKVRLESIIAIGGISPKKTTQHAKVTEFLRQFLNDKDESVRFGAEAFLPSYAPKASVK